MDLNGSADGVDVIVIGAGQAGLAAAYHLVRRGFAPSRDFVVLDGDDEPGGAWRHRWPSLTMEAVHGVHDLPGMPLVAEDPDARASEVMADYFARYERTLDLPVQRPVAVRAVREGAGGTLVVESDAGTWSTRTLINATGTWTRPFWPAYPGAASFRGRQLHTADYTSAEELRGRAVVVVGGGHSAIQLLAEISEVTSTTWVTRRPPRWRDTPLDQNAGRQAVALVEQAVADPRIHLLGYGPSASTIGATRAARAAVASIRRLLDDRVAA